MTYEDAKPEESTKRPSLAKCSVSVSPHDVQVRVNGIPHLVLRRADLVGIQGYIKNVGPVEPIYFVEFTTRTGSISCDYADRGL